MQTVYVLTRDATFAYQETHGTNVFYGVFETLGAALEYIGDEFGDCEFTAATQMEGTVYVEPVYRNGDIFHPYYWLRRFKITDYVPTAQVNEPVLVRNITFI